MSRDAMSQPARLGGGMCDRLAPRNNATGEARRGVMASEQNGFALFGRNLFGDAIVPPSGGLIADKFTLPPFTVLSARDGAWQDRKRAWLSLGIQSEVGRGANTLQLSAEAEAYRNGTYAQANHAAPGGGALPAANYKNRERGSGSGSAISGTSANGVKRNEPTAETYNSGAPGAPGAPGALGAKYAATAVSQKLAPGGGGGGCWLGGPKTESSAKFNNGEDEDGLTQGNQSGTSIFDPVLTELCYRWFCPKGGLILDPFAGGSVRGLVAGLLGYRYHGIDLRPEQIAANEAQLAAIAPAADIQWRVGDSRDELGAAPDADFVFTCPPYGDLEKYSDDPSDLSAMTYADFCAAYRDILTKAAARLKPNRFLAVVVGEFRDPKTGLYRGFVPFTQAACVAAGLGYYNEAILVTAVGSLPIRITKQFEAGRKMGKTHQNILVFVKGDSRAAADACEGQLGLPL